MRVVPKAILRELFHHLPAYFFFFNGYILLYFSLAWLNPPQTGMSWLIIFPLLVGFIYYAIRIQMDTTIKKKGFWFVFLAILLVGLTVGIKWVTFFWMVGPTLESHIHRIRIFHEIYNFIWFILIFTHCYLRRGIKDLGIYIGVPFLYGILLENGGITLGYFFEDGYSVYAPFLVAPVATMCGWTIVFYSVITVYEKIIEYFQTLAKNRIVLRAVIISLLALCVDIFLDPIAVKLGFWTWNVAYKPGSTLFIYGDPIVNFLSWFFALFTFGVAFEIVRDCHGWCGRHKAVALLIGLPVIQTAAAAGLFGTMALIEGFSGPTITILLDFLNKLF